MKAKNISHWSLRVAWVLIFPILALTFIDDELIPQDAAKTLVVCGAIWMAAALLWMLWSQWKLTVVDKVFVIISALMPIVSMTQTNY